MPWGKPHDFVCIEPGCGKEFTSIAINPLRCPDCRAAHNHARIKQRYRERRGALFGKRQANKPLSEAARFNLFMARTWMNAICPECGRHMSECRCCEPEVRKVKAVSIETFDPIALPVPAVCADGETWQPWKS